jgi:tetratricopeptide (TPR) repeat protein
MINEATHSPHLKPFSTYIEIQNEINLPFFPYINHQFPLRKKFSRLMKSKLYLLRFLPLLALFLWAGSLSAQNANHYNELGNQALEAGNFDQAVDYYAQAIRRNPYNGVYYRNRAHAHFSSGDYHRATSDYSKAIRYYRNDPSVVARLYYQRGLCGYILNDFSSALQDFTSAIAMRPGVSDAYYFRGKIQKLVYGRELQAQRDFQKVLRLGPNQSIQAAFAHVFLGDTYEGEAVMLQLLRNSNEGEAEYANVSYNMGGLQAVMGNEEKAVHYLDIALRNGFREFEWLKRDMNFDKIRYGRPFRELVRNLDRYADGSMIATRPQPQPQQPFPNPGRQDGPQAPADLVIESLTFSDNDGNNRIDASESTYITFTLRNQGQGKAYGMELRMSELNGVNGLGYTQSKSLGDLNPLAQRLIKIQINGGLDLVTDQAEFKLEVREKNGFDSRPVRISVSTQAYLEPELAIVDHHFTAPNGGKMQLGIPVNLKMAVQNRGQGIAEQVVLEMKVPNNVFTAGSDRFEIGTLQPGESKIIDFEFFTNRRYSDSEVPILAEISERLGKFGVRKGMTVAVNQQLEADSRVVIRSGPLAKVDIDDIRLQSDVDKNLPRTSMVNPDAIAVVIGNRDYQNPDVPPVDYALQDAASIKRYLTRVFGFDENNIIMLANATQADFNGTFGTAESHKARLYNLVKPGQSDVFVYYSGHGAPDIAENAGYFVPVDCDPSLVKFNGYAMKTFHQNLSKIPYRSLTVVIDACFSGSSDKGTLLAQTSLARIKSETGTLNDPNAVIMTSATGDQVSSWYPDQYHSLFTYYFLKGIQGAANKNQDRTLSLGELRQYLNEEVPYMARRLRNRVQTPEIKGRNEKVFLKY